MYFNRFDICEAYYFYAMNYHGGQFSKEYAIFGRLHNMGFKMRPLATSNPNEELEENSREIYEELIQHPEKVRMV